MNKIIKFVCDQLVKWCIKNNRVYKITGGPAGETVYLVRYIVHKSKFGCIYIHRFMRSDADDPHDHPWNFWTYVVSGGYTEIFYDKTKQVTEAGTRSDGIRYSIFHALWVEKFNKRKPGSIAYRKATDIHQVVVDKSRNMDEIEEAPYTICLMGPRRRDWGFWLKPLKGTGFLDWREYLSITPEDERIEGSE